HGLNLVGLTLGEAFEPLHRGIIPRAREALERQIRDLDPPRSVDVARILDARSSRRAVGEILARSDAGVVIVGIDRAEARPRGPSEIGVEIAAETGAAVLLTGGELSWPPRTAHVLEPKRSDERRATFDFPHITVAGRDTGDPRTDLALASGDRLALEDQVRRWAESACPLDLLLLPDPATDSDSKPTAVASGAVAPLPP